MDDTKVPKDESVDTPEYQAVQGYFANVTSEQFWNDWHHVQPNGESKEHQEWADFLKDSAEINRQLVQRKKNS